MTLSTSNTDPQPLSLEGEPAAMENWLSHPDTWPTILCRECQAGMRVPFAPTDGLCGDCRARAQANECVKTALSADQLLSAAGAPCKYAGLTRVSWEQRYGPWSAHPQLRQLLGWPNKSDPDSWLLLITSRGHDERKTGLATAVLGEALVAGFEGQWLSQSGWLRDIKASWTRDNATATEDSLWRRAAEVEVLLFDDFGGDGGKSWWRTQVTDLIHHRESHRLATIITAKMVDWKEVRKVHESLLTRMNVSLKIALPPHRTPRRRA